MYVLKEKDGSIYARYTNLILADYILRSTNVWRITMGLSLLTLDKIEGGCCNVEV